MKHLVSILKKSGEDSSKERFIKIMKMYEYTLRDTH